MRFFNTFIIVAVAMTAFVVAAPSTTAVSNTATSNFNANNALLARTEDGTCPHAKRHTCGQYMLEDGTRQDFVSQVFNCIPREQFICHKFDYQTAKPTHPGETNHMVAAKIEPGCECWFYSVACDGTQYKEVWEGWESVPGLLPWSRPVYTHKKFTGWWCMEYN